MNTNQENCMIVKFEIGGDLHRRRLNKSTFDSMSFEEFSKLLEIKIGGFKMSWLDEDGDWCALTNDAEFADIKSSAISPIRIKVVVIDEQSAATVAPAAVEVTPPPMLPCFWTHQREQRFAAAKPTPVSAVGGEVPLSPDDGDAAVALTIAAIERAGCADKVEVINVIGAPLRIARTNAAKPVLGGHFVTKVFRTHQAGGTDAVDEFVRQRLAWLINADANAKKRGDKQAEKFAKKSIQVEVKGQNRLAKINAKLADLDEHPSAAAAGAPLARAGGPPAHVVEQRRARLLQKQANVVAQIQAQQARLDAKAAKFNNTA